MSKRTITYTHKGWFLLCPIYIGAVDSDAPDIAERLAIFYPILVLSELIFGLLVEFRLSFDPTFEPLFPIMITGPLTPNITAEISE